MTPFDRSVDIDYDAGVAAAYEDDRRMESIWPREQSYVDRVMSCAPSGATVLDVPVGTGRFLDIYQARGLRALGLDISAPMLEQAARRVRSESVELRLGDAANLQFPDGSFDIVVCWRLLHLLPPERIDPFVSELLRVCRGELHVQAYVRDRWYWWLRARKSLLRIPQSTRLPSRPKSYTWSHIRAYGHPESLLLNCFARHGSKVEHAETLGLDGALRVRVYRLTRTQDR